jgi:hypothetical protein
MSPPKAVCGKLITSRRSVLALAWTLTTCLSLFSFIVAMFLAIRIIQQYSEYNSEYGGEYGNRYLEGGDGGNSNSGEGDGEESHSNDREKDEDFFSSLTQNSRGLLFASVYTTILGLGLSLYGSTVVIGFMSLIGEYIPPCFNFRSMSIEEEDPSTVDPALGPRKLWAEKIHRGVFLGSLVIFSNLLILCAVIFGELQVNGNYNNDDDYNIFESMFSYRVERITSVFAATCLVLAFLYILFAVLYLTCGGMSDDDDDDTDGYPTSPTSTASRSGIFENRLFEMPTKKRRRRKHRRDRPIDPGKQEPLVGERMRMTPHVGITDNGGFITDVKGLSDESSSSFQNLPELT